MARMPIHSTSKSELNTYCANYTTEIMPLLQGEEKYTKYAIKHVYHALIKQFILYQTITLFNNIYEYLPKLLEEQMHYR